MGNQNDVILQPHFLYFACTLCSLDTRLIFQFISTWPFETFQNMSKRKKKIQLCLERTPAYNSPPKMEITYFNIFNAIGTLLQSDK
jgi:hypothetical protein